MGLKMGVVGTLVAVLVGIVVGAQVLATVFSTGGPFANIQGAVQGTCNLTQGTFSNLVFTDAPGGDVWAEVPSTGLRVNSGERAVTGLVASQTGLSITTPSGVLAIAWFPVNGINYIVATDGTVADFATAAPNVVTCDPGSSVSAVVAAASAGNVAVAGATTAITGNSYAGIINALLALIPLAIIGGVALYFWSARGGGRSRGRRRR